MPTVCPHRELILYVGLNKVPLRRTRKSHHLDQKPKLHFGSLFAPKLLAMVPVSHAIATQLFSALFDRCSTVKFTEQPATVRNV